jgi:hypothetical protein
MLLKWVLRRKWCFPHPEFMREPPTESQEEGYYGNLRGSGGKEERREWRLES